MAGSSRNLICIRTIRCTINTEMDGSGTQDRNTESLLSGLEEPEETNRAL